MAEERAKIVLDGDVSPLRQKLREAANDLNAFGKEGESAFSRMSGPLKVLQERFVAIGALLAGGAVFKEAVAVTVTHTEESIKLGRALGISAGEASILRVALDANNTSQEEFVSSAQKLAKQVRENESALQAMGLQTRDSAGELRPLNELTMSALEVLNGYKAGTDRAIAAQVLFGRGFELTTNLVNINKKSVAELAEVQRDLGAVVGGENVAAWQAYDDAGDKATLTLKAMKLTIGNALLPVLTDLGNWFTSTGPAAVTVIKGAFGGLIATFHFVTTGVTVLWETLNAMVISVAEPIRALGEAIGRALGGDWKGAAQALGNVGPTISGAWGKALDEMTAKAQSTRDRISVLFGTPTDAAAPATGGKSGAGLIKPDDNKSDKALKARIKAEEDAFKAAVKAAEEYEAQWEREYNAVVNAARKSAKERIAIEMLQAEGAREATHAHIAEMEAQSAHEVALGITTQAEHLARLAQFNQQRLEADQLYQEQKRQLALQDPEQNPVELERIEQEKAAIRRRYAAEGADIQRNQALESRNIWQSLTSSMQSGFANVITGVLNGTLSMGQAIRGLMQTVVNAVIGMLAQTAAQYLVNKLLEMVIGKTTAASQISANAAVAATAAMGSVAAIPFVGWAMAPGVGAATFATAMGYQGALASAEGGYDIPKGLNPMAQLHEEEMVLPSKFANVIRGLANGGGEGRTADAGGDVHIYARNDSDVVRVGDMKKLLREMKRNFVDVRPT